MRLVQHNKRRRYGKVLHQSTGKPGPTFSRSFSRTDNVVHLRMEDTTETASGDANRYYELEAPRNEMVDMIGGLLTLMMPDTPASSWDNSVARVRAALTELGLI